MKVNFKQSFQDFNGKMSNDQFSDYAINAILAPQQGGVSGAALLDKYDLATKIKTSTSDGVEISNQEKESILKEIERVYATPLVYKRFVELFEKPAKTPQKRP